MMSLWVCSSSSHSEMYDSMQIFMPSCSVSFPLNSLGHETLDESSLKSAVVRLNTVCVIAVMSLAEA